MLLTALRRVHPSTGDGRRATHGSCVARVHTCPVTGRCRRCQETRSESRSCHPQEAPPRASPSEGPESGEAREVSTEDASPSREPGPGLHGASQAHTGTGKHLHNGNAGPVLLCCGSRTGSQVPASSLPSALSSTLSPVLSPPALSPVLSPHQLSPVLSLVLSPVLSSTSSLSSALSLVLSSASSLSAPALSPSELRAARTGAERVPWAL